MKFTLRGPFEALVLRLKNRSFSKKCGTFLVGLVCAAFPASSSAWGCHALLKMGKYRNFSCMHLEEHKRKAYTMALTVFNY